MVSTHDYLGAKMVKNEPKSLALALFEIDFLNVTYSYQVLLWQVV